MFIQEAEISPNMPIDLLKVEKYELTMSKNQPKSRLICYKNESLKAEIRTFENIELVHVTTNKHDIFGLYRPFKLPQGYTSKSYIEKIVDTITSSRNQRHKLVICGDINLDHRKIHENQYHQSKLCEVWNGFVNNESLFQYIQETTWQRIINNVTKESILDHFYAEYETKVNIDYELTAYSDHKIITATINKCEPKKKTSKFTYVRRWKNYSKETLVKKKKKIDWNRTVNLGVQDHADYLDQNLNLALETIAPEIKLKTKEKSFNWSMELVKLKRAKTNLWKKYKRTGDVTIINKIKLVDNQFKSRFRELERAKVRNKIKPSDPKSFWRTVKMTLGKNDDGKIPMLNYENRLVEDNTEKAELFAKFFREKIDNLDLQVVDEERINIQNRVEPKNFNTLDLLMRVIKSLKPKRCYGIDRTPMTVLKDGFEIIKHSLLDLLNKVYVTKQIPSQWKVARIIPIHKKGQRCKIDNYRPISNLCSMAKIFERMILLRLIELETENGLDLTGSEQYGFKAKSSTNTAMLQIQAKITEYLEDNMETALLSLDLTAAFDTVDHDLLITRIQNLGVPNDVTKLLESWLKNRSAYVECEEETSFFFDVKKGTVQGSVLGPILFAMFVRNLTDVEPITMFADDNYLVTGEKNITLLKSTIQRKTQRLFEWLKRSGLKVNLNTTELIIFNNSQSQEIMVNGQLIQSQKSMKVLGVMFDYKLNWSDHINYVANKIKQLTFGFSRLKKFYSINELLALVTTLGMSMLYYGAPIWLSRNLHDVNKRKLMSASAGLIRSCLNKSDWSMVSFSDLHQLAGKATPMMMADYYQAMSLKSIMDNGSPTLVWTKLQVNCRISRRSGGITFGNESRNLSGKHNFANRVFHISKKLPIGWENMTTSMFKKTAKDLFIRLDR